MKRHGFVTDYPEYKVLLLHEFGYKGCSRKWLCGCILPKPNIELRPNATTSLLYTQIYLRLDVSSTPHLFRPPAAKLLQISEIIPFSADSEQATPYHMMREREGGNEQQEGNSETRRDILRKTPAASGRRRARQVLMEQHGGLVWSVHRS